MTLLDLVTLFYITVLCKLHFKSDWINSINERIIFAFPHPCHDTYAVKAYMKL